MNRLIAHRGDMTTYPENSLLAFQSAAELGFQFLELDIQMSKDLQPIVIHDDSLKRTTGMDKKVWELSSEEIESVPLLYTDYHKSNQKLLNVPSLDRVIQLVNRYSKLNVFVEIKKESIEKFGVERVVNRVLEIQQQAKFNVVVISFLSSVIEYVHHKQRIPTGYVLKKYNKQYLNKAIKMQPDYLFCNVKKINKPNELPTGSWKWALYDIMNPDFAYELLKQGVDLIETGDIVKLSGSDYFN